MNMIDIETLMDCYAPMSINPLGGPKRKRRGLGMRQAFRMSFDPKKAIQSKDVAAVFLESGYGRIAPSIGSLG